jgi:SAM-dependent methyltransferase
MPNNTLTELEYMARTHGKVSEDYYTVREVSIGYKVLDALPLQDRLVLDIGAFAGFVGNYCRNLGAKPILIDIFRGAFPDFMPAVQASNEAMPFADNTFDYVVCGDTLHHGCLEKTTQEIFRVLKPGGTFVSVREPCISSKENEQEVLEKDCGKLLLSGVCERRPNLFQYAAAFTAFDGCDIYNGLDLAPAVDHNWGGNGIVIVARKS